MFASWVCRIPREGVLRVVELLEESPRDAGYSTRYDTKKPGMEELLEFCSRGLFSSFICRAPPLSLLYFFF